MEIKTIEKLCIKKQSHNNPVEAGLVFKAEDLINSSAADYANATRYNRAGAGVSG